VAWAILAEPADGACQITVDQPAIITGDGRPLLDAVLNLHRETIGAAEPAMVRLWADLVAALVGRHLAPVRVDQRLWRLWEEIDADLGQLWTLGDLARRADLSAEQLRRLCLRHHGTAPMQYLTRLRMRRAAALLATGDRDIAQVGQAVGYANAFAFSTAFRRHHGVPPTRLRG
jgi:transcriptional regulator GlxA family with amidase domain